MYNRYIRNDNGTYTRIPQEDAPDMRESSASGGTSGHMPRDRQEHSGEESSREERREAAREEPFRRREPRDGPSAQGTAGSRVTDALTGTLRHALDQLHLEHVDTGDLLILVLLFLLFREDADEELLVALGLLLIL